MEAKGSSNNFNNFQIQYGKKQVSTILSIEGSVPLKVVSEAYFNSSLSVEYVDPKTEEEIEIIVEKKYLHKHYYEVLKALFETIPEEKTIILKNFQFKGTMICGMNYYVGIPVEIHNHLENLEDLSNYISKMKETLHNNYNVFIDDDGIIIMDKSKLNI